MLYVTEGILISKKEIKDREASYVLLTRDFWKIRGFYKETLKGGFYDIGTFVEVSIRRKTETNQFQSFKTKGLIHQSGLQFEDITDFLNILHFVQIHIPEGGGEGEVYEDLKTLILETTYPEVFQRACALFQLRMLTQYQAYQALPPDPILQKLEHLAQNHTLKELLKIQGIPPHIRTPLRLAFLQSFFPWYSSSV